MSIEHDRRRTIERQLAAFLAVANRKGIEKIEDKIHRGFLTTPPSAGARKQVERQLRSWVETNPEGSCRHAIPAATALYQTLFGAPTTSRSHRKSARSARAVRQSGSTRAKTMRPTYSLAATALLAEAPALRADRQLVKPAIRLASDGRVELTRTTSVRTPGAVPVFQRHEDRLLTWRSLPHRHQVALLTKARGDRFGAAHGNAARLGSANSEDALTWSSLVALERCGPEGWMGRLAAAALHRVGNPTEAGALPSGNPEVSLWETCPPPERYPVREGRTEVDVIVRLGRHLFAMEAKIGASFSAGTTHDPHRHQLVRHIDVATALAKRENRTCWPLALFPSRRLDLLEEVRSYVRDPAVLQAALPHRQPQEVRALARRIGALHWEDILQELGVSPEGLPPVGVPSRRRIPHPDRATRPLTDLYTRPLSALGRTLQAQVDELRGRDWRSLFLAEREDAPRRHARKKRYLVGHTGIPSTGAATNRGEEHLAMAIFNRHGPRGGPMDVRDGAALKVLDYQVPLKARRDDHGVGKIDLLGVEHPGRLAVIELKAATPGADAPLKAALQGLAYAAITSANKEDIIGEIRRSQGPAVDDAPLLVVVMADHAYWSRQGVDEPGRPALQPLRPLLDQIGNATGIGFRFVDIGEASFEYGLAGSAPRLLQELDPRIILSAGDTRSARPRIPGAGPA